VFNLNYYTHTLVKIGSTRFGKTLYSILAGAAGTSILVIFFAGIMRASTIGFLLPVVIGFNAALTGYMVLEKTRNAFKHKRSVSIGTGAAMVLTATLILNTLFFKGAGIYLIFSADLLLLLLVAVVFSWLGGSIAVKYFKLTQ
jgi:hypothetical protein